MFENILVVYFIVSLAVLLCLVLSPLLFRFVGERNFKKAMDTFDTTNENGEANE